MTGLGWNGSYMYTSNTYSSYEGCDRFSFTGTSFSTKNAYISDYYGTPTGYDISYQPGDGSIWMARDNATSPVAAYEETSGGVLQGLSASIGIGSDCRGLAFETGSSRYLWVSNISTDELYRIDLDVGVEEGSYGAVPGALRLECSQNPFSGSVVLLSDGVEDGALLEIFDLSGRSVLETQFSGSFCWNAEALPPGAYIARLRSSGGEVSTLMLTRF